MDDWGMGDDKPKESKAPVKETSKFGKFFKIHHDKSQPKDSV